MTPYENKPQTIKIFGNKSKTEERHPDSRGQAFLSRAFIEALLSEQDGELISIDVSFWKKESESGTKWMSGQIQKPFKPSEPAMAPQKPRLKDTLPKAPAMDDDDPF